MITKNFRLNALANTYAAVIYHDVTLTGGALYPSILSVSHDVAEPAGGTDNEGY
ncbi:hypothetical protein [Xenorhabdus miraniensis]|uniref:Prophage protein n=1 Tax=Xenorhabdus miraniensis TaxID=351674 RepID=A0A2D0JLG6_9GAMM|nr:hypothetical protein [Xenorhabdus miraniensis]PHM47142.1 prophage protein [Xenorhabdus miraniensis]